MHAFTYTNWSKLVKMVTNLLLPRHNKFTAHFFRSPLCELCGPSGALNGTAQTHARRRHILCAAVAANVLKKDTRNWLQHVTSWMQLLKKKYSKLYVRLFYSWLPYNFMANGFPPLHPASLHRSKKGVTSEDANAMSVMSEYGILSCDDSSIDHAILLNAEMHTRLMFTQWCENAKCCMSTMSSDLGGIIFGWSIIAHGCYIVRTFENPKDGNSRRAWCSRPIILKTAKKRKKVHSQIDA